MRRSGEEGVIIVSIWECGAVAAVLPTTDLPCSVPFLLDLSENSVQEPAANHSWWSTIKLPPLELLRSYIVGIFDDAFPYVDYYNLMAGSSPLRR